MVFVFFNIRKSIFSHRIFFKLKCNWFTALCQFPVCSKVTQSYIYIIFYHGLSQETGCNSLCCTVEPHFLSILNVTVCIYQPQTPNQSCSSSPHPWQPQVYSPCLWVCFCFEDRFICAIFYIPQASAIIYYVSFWLDFT